MKKNQFIWMAILLMTITSCTKDDVNEMANADKSTAITKAEITDILTIETDTVGQVAEKIGDHLTVQKLIISGPINAADVDIIRSLPNLVAIDMKNTTIMGGNESYTVYIDNIAYTYTINDNEIGERMFYGTQLSEITLPNKINKIRPYAFKSLRGNSEYKFQEIIIPESVTEIGTEAFSDCINLNRIELSESLQAIYSLTFDGCENLSYVDIKENVTDINDYAFRNCHNLQSITLPQNLINIGSFSFASSGLTNITIPNSVTTIKNRAFEDCVNLQSITLPEGLTKIETETFKNCISLTSIILPNTIEIIDFSAFYNCESLSQVEIPGSISRIENHAFAECTKLQNVTFISSLKNSSIASYVFENSGLVSVTITDNVKTIGSFCFSGCKSLTSIKLPNTLTALSNSTFQGCTALESIIIPNNVIYIGSDCFRGCSKLSNITLPDMLESIGDATFIDCAELKNLDLSNMANLKRIGNYAFQTSGLIKASLPEGLETIGNSTFSNCINLESITVPTSVTAVDNYYITDTPNLTSVFWNTSIPMDYFHHSSNPYCLYYIANENVQIENGTTINTIIKGVSEEIRLVGDDPKGKFFVPQAFKAKKISFSQYVSNNETKFLESSNWRSIVLPFAVSDITFSDSNERTLAPFNANVEDAKPFWLRRLTSNGFENVTQIEAGIPYIYALPNNSNYDSEYNFSNGDITFSAEDPNGITIPATGDMVQDAGPAFILHANYETIPMADNIYVLNETYDESRLYGSVFVRNERDARPFEGYVTPLSTSAANAPAFFSIDGSTPRTRSAKPLGPIPSIDDM